MVVVVPVVTLWRRTVPVMVDVRVEREEIVQKEVKRAPNQNN